MTEKKVIINRFESPRENKRYRLVGEGDRWRCIRCGSCCNTDFEEHWLDFISVSHTPRTIDGKCSKLKIEHNKHSCSIYSNRPNACKTFPFTIRKQDDGNYRLVIHGKCNGFGKGNIINIKQRILQCLNYSNKEFHKRMRLDFASFENNISVGLVK